MAQFMPVNQKRLTNVCVVRLRKKGNRYEIACYPNKVQAWRDKLETNIDEVLQTHGIFTNVSKGLLATSATISRDFETDDFESVLLQILRDGEVQVTGKERKFQIESLYRDVAKIVSEKCINPENNRAYTVTMIEKMMKECHINLQPRRSAKQNALQVIRQLRSAGTFKIAPAMMEIQISLDPKLVESVSPHILQLVHHIIRQEKNQDGIFELTAVVEPEMYHNLMAALNEHAKDRHCVEILGAAQPSRSWKRHLPPTSSVYATPNLSAAIVEEETREFRERPSKPPEVPSQTFNGESNSIEEQELKEIGKGAQVDRDTPDAKTVTPKKVLQDKNRKPSAYDD